MNINYWIDLASKKLKESRVNSLEPRLDAELILAHVLDVQRTHLHAHPKQELNLSDQKVADGLLARRIKDEPLAYIVGKREFYGYEFRVTSEVLIPRPESELMIEIALKRISETSTRPVRCLDVGCGSGALGLSLALELTKQNIDYQINLSDISPNALKIAKLNRDRLEALNTNFVQKDLLTNSSNQYHFILANLPYLDPEQAYGAELKFEPASALYARQNGLELIYKLINQIVKQKNLTPGGWLLIESEPNQQLTIASYLSRHGFSQIKHQNFITWANFDYLDKHQV